MSDRHLHSDPERPRQLASRDPIEIQLYLRDLRYAYIKANARKLLLFASRFVRQRFKPSSQNAAGERAPLTTAARALIANLTAMR